MKSRLPKDDEGNPIIKPKPGSRPALAVVRNVPGKQAAARPKAKAQGKAVNADGATPKESKTSIMESESESNGSPEESTEYEWNDSGNGDLLLKLHGEDLRFVSEVGRDGKWYAWSGAGWEPGKARANSFALDVAKIRRDGARRLLMSADNEVKKAGKALDSFAVRCGNDGALTAMLRQASLRDGSIVPLSTFDSDPTLLPFHNQVVELGRDGTSVREHRREDYVRTAAAVDYAPAARSPRWEAFLELFLPDPEIRDFIQRLAGYSLFGGNPERLLIFLVGPSSTGKSTFVELLGKALGPQLSGLFNLSLFRDKGHDAPRPDLLKAFSRRLIHTSEASSEWRLHADAVKRMTGHDGLQARGMNSDEMREATPHFTPWIATNRAPTIEHADPALWRRLVAVPFVTVVPESINDTNFRSGFPDDELAGVIAWAVAGWDMYRRDGLADRPQAVVETTAALRRSMSSLDQFIDECCVVAPSDWVRESKHVFDEYTVRSGPLYEAYGVWFEESGLPTRDKLARNAFGEKMEERGFITVKPREPDQPPNGDTKFRARAGLRLNDDVLELATAGNLRFRRV